MVAMLAPPGVSTGAQVKVLSGTTYTVDANGYISVTAQVDAIALQNMGFLQVATGRNSFAATADPAVGNDGTQDYAAGSLWINTTASPNRAWVCVSNATGAAVWLQTSLGALIATANSATIGGLTLSGLVTFSASTGVTAFSGGGQSSATTLANDFSNVTTATASTAPFDSVKFAAAMVPGQKHFITNNAANPCQLFGFNTDSINGFASSTGVTLPVGFLGDVCCPVAGTLQIKGLPSFAGNFAYNTNTATSGTTLTGANVTGGQLEVVLNLTGTLGGGANAQMPTVANLVSAIPNAVAGQEYKLRIINSSSASDTWTVTTNTGWTLTGTMTIAQNTWREFFVSLTTLSAAVLQQIGTGTNS
jgi:hypothetical protein